MTIKTREVSLEPIEITANYTVTEEVKKLLASAELSEEQGDSIVTLFETAVNNQAKVCLEGLTEKYNESLTTKIEEVREDIVDSVSNYFDVVVEEWTRENNKELKLSVLAGRNSALVDGLVALLKENYVEIPEDRADIVMQLSESIEQLRRDLEVQENTNIELRNENNGHYSSEIFNKLSEGLAETEVENFRTLVEDFDINDPAVFEKKARIVRQSYFKKTLKEDIDQTAKKNVESKKTSDDFVLRTAHLLRSTQ